VTRRPRDAAVAQNRLAELCLAADTTLFLDQVSELSPASQTRLLHAILQAGDFATGASMASDFRAGEAGDFQETAAPSTAIPKPAQR